MPLADLLHPEQRQWLRRLRRRIANREVMRRHRAANRDKRLCAGVDLPLDAGTCGRLVWPAYERCHACHRRRQWLLNHALNPAETAVVGLLESIENAAARRRLGRGRRPEHAAARRPVPTLRSLPALVAPKT